MTVQPTNNLVLVKPAMIDEAAFAMPDKLTSEEDQDAAAQLMIMARTLKADITKTYNEMLSPLNQKRGVVLKWKRDDLGLVDSVIDRLSGLLDVYVTQIQDQQAKDAQEALNAAQGEAQDERNAEISEMIDLAESGDTDTETSKALIERAEEIRNVPPPIVKVFDEDPPPQERLKSLGLKRTIKYKAVVKDTKELCRAIADGSVPIEAVKANLPFLNKRATALRDDFAGMTPGCELAGDAHFGRLPKGGSR